MLDDTDDRLNKTIVQYFTAGRKFTNYCYVTKTSTNRLYVRMKFEIKYFIQYNDPACLLTLLLYSVLIANLIKNFLNYKHGIKRYDSREESFIVVDKTMGFDSKVGEKN